MLRKKLQRVDDVRYVILKTIARQILAGVFYARSDGRIFALGERLGFGCVRE